MKVYIIQIQFANGGNETKFSTENRQYAACFCKSLNETNKKLKSPNRYFFEEVELEDVEPWT